MKMQHRFSVSFFAVLILATVCSTARAESYTWATKDLSGGRAYWRYSAMSSDGKTILLGAAYNSVWISTDSGATFTQRNPNGDGYPTNSLSGWCSAGMSSDGTQIVVCATGDYVYTSTNTGATWTQRQPAGATLKNWNAVAISANGTKMTACASGDYVYTSTDSGATWTQRQPAGAVTKTWTSITMSSDGTKIAACASGDYVYTSTDSGATWTQRQPAGAVTKTWNAVAMSSDGTQIAADAGGDYVYTSTDSGATWTKRQPAGVGVTKTWQAITMSSDGTKLSAAAGSDYIYTSTDSGATWTQRQPAGATTLNWRNVTYSPDGSRLVTSAYGTASVGTYSYMSTDNGATWTTLYPPNIYIKIDSCGVSANGAKIIAGAEQLGDPVYTSTDNGATFALSQPASPTVGRTWYASAVSGDGSKMATCALSNYVYTSTDGGSTWTKCQPAGVGITKTWDGVAMSSDATVLIVSAYNDYIYTSTDGGNTWTKRQPAGAGVTKLWNAVTISSDGTKMAAGASSDYIYTSADGGATWTKQQPAGAGVTKTWDSITMSSDGTKLAAGADNEYVYTSTDSGATWTVRQPAGASGQQWLGIAMSSDGSHIATCAWGNYIYTSIDGGATWTLQAISGAGVVEKYYGISMTSDGHRIVVAGQRLYIGDKNPDPSVVTWNTPADITYGTALSATQLNATANVPGTFVYTPAAGTVLNAGAAQTLSVAFTPTDTANYLNGSGTVSINVTKAPLTVTAANKTKTYGAANPTLTASFSGFVNGDTAAVISGAPALSTTATLSSVVGNYPITAAAGTLSAANYTFSYTAGTLSVTQATPTITWANPADITYGTALGATQLNATASVPGSLVYTPASGVVLSAGAAQTLSVAFTPTDTVNYTNASGNVSINVTKASLTVTADPKSKIYGTANPALTASFGGFVNGDTAAAISGAPALSTTATSSSVVGSYPITAAVGTLSAANYAFSYVSGSLSVTSASTVITWADPADITYGTPLSATQLNATASVPGTFAYTPAAGTVLQSGAGQNLAVVFTPADPVNYAGASAAVVINVRKTALSVTADAKSKFYGDANPTLTASFSGLVNGDTVAAITGSPALSTTAVAGSATGAYPISVSVTPLSAANYTFSAVAGTLTVNPRTDVTPPVVVIPPTVVVGGQPNFTISGPGATNISWNFGDGQIGAGALPAHDYAAPGVYQVTVTFTDPTTGLTQSQTTTVTVQPQSFRVRSADFMLNSGSDRAAITGIVNIPDGLSMAGQTFVFTVGGSTRSFVLDARGRAKLTDGSSLSVKLKTSKGVSVQHEASFQLNMLGNLSSALKSKMPLDAAGFPTAITVELQFNGTFYASTQSTQFKKGPRGAAAKSKYF